MVGKIYSSHEWQKWTVDSQSVKPLPGEYFVKFFNDKKGLMGVVRDPLGLMPVYYTVKGCLKIFNTLKDAAQSLPDIKINWDYIHSIIADNFTLYDQSPFQEIFRLPPGYLLYNNGTAWKTRSYFSDISPSSHKNFRDLFFEVICERATAHPNFLLSFSGGLDSSLLLATLLKHNLPARAATLIFDDPLASEDVALCAFENVWGPCFKRISAPHVNSNMYNWSKNDCYLYNPTETLFYPLFYHAQKNNIQNIWTGYGADEVFTLNSCLMSALILSGNFTEFRRALKDPFQNEGGLSQTVYSLIKDLAPTWLKLIIAKSFSPKSTLPQARYYKKRDRIERLRRRHIGTVQGEFIERLFHSGYIAFASEQSHELTHPLGLTFSYPYLDLRLVSAALSFAPQDFYKNGLNKFTLRNQFCDILPHEITGRVSRQAYDTWMIDVWNHQSNVLDNNVQIASQKYSLNSQPKNVYDKLKLLYLSQFILKERSNESKAESKIQAKGTWKEKSKKSLSKTAN